MKKSHQLSEAAFKLDGKMPLKQAIPLGLQHVLAMFVGNLTPLLIITGACGIAGGEFADLQLHLLQNAMLVAGIVTLVQMFSIGEIVINTPGPAIAHAIYRATGKWFRELPITPEQIAMSLID